VLTDVSRRVFLKVIAAGAATTAGALTGCSSSNDGNNAACAAVPFGDVTAGNLSDLPGGTVKAVSGAPAFVGRDANGIYAMTSTCTHTCCDLALSTPMTTTAIVCGCHNSHFDLNGNVLTGPATSPLVHFAIEVATDGTITVHGGQTVAASVRTAV
jgi:Rieske Fe-S protein